MPAGKHHMKGLGTDVRALVQKELLEFSERCKQYQQTGVMSPIGDPHVVLTNKLALVRLVAGEPNMLEAYEGVLALAESWQDERMWEACVKVEMRDRAASSSLEVQQHPMESRATSIAGSAEGASSNPLPAPSTPCPVLTSFAKATCALSPEKLRMVERNRAEALERRDALRAKKAHPVSA